MRVIFSIGDVSSEVHLAGRRNHILKAFKNNRLCFRLANSFLDTSLLIGH